MGQDLVRVQPGGVPVFGLELPVGRRAGVVHDPGGLVGGVVEKVNAQVPGHPAAYGLVFLGGYRPGQGDHEPQAGLLRGMLVGWIDRHGAAVHQVEGVQHIGLGEVGVEGEQSAVFHAPRLAPALLQPAAHIGPHVLDAVLFVLTHLEIFLDGFFGGGSPQQGGKELGPKQLFVFPGLGHPGAEGGDMDFSVIAQAYHGVPSLQKVNT